MIDPENLLELAESLIHAQTNIYCSDLHRKILIATLRGERKTYEELADESGYSPKYIKHDIAPKLWHLLSEAVGQKVTKSNVRAILEERMRQNRNLSPSKIAQAVSPIPASAPITNSSQPLTSTPPISTRASILLVDDEPKNLRLLSELLEEQGYEVRQAISGTIAIQAISLAAPDLILLDICMPELDGYSVCQKLKANPDSRDIPIIFVTGLDEPWNKVKAFSVGGVDYINKPFKVIEVLARIENQLKIQQLQKELLAQNAQLQQALQELQRLAAIDSLTQVSSRDRFDEYLIFNWHQAREAPCSLTLIFCEIDLLERDLNSTGNQVKEQLLFQLAQILKNIFQRPSDLIARYEDITFGIILPNLAMAKSEEMARTLLARVEKIQIPSISSIDTLSIGMATAFLPDEKIKLETFVTNCARALERAKSEGGNRIVLV
ncbi:MAG: response regulator [Prochloraceae cyanobacterium]|nr:response regulator [Prochloraceae cyanobacterium]